MMAWSLFALFFKVGLFSIGGGLATLPLMQVYLLEAGWVSAEEFVDMIVIAESTPGPIGVNMATFAGYKAGGALGGVIATAGLILPAFMITLLLARFLQAWRRHPLTGHVMSALRPAAIGMIAAAAWFVIDNAVVKSASLLGTGRPDWPVWGMFAVLSAIYARFRPHPVLCIAGGALLALLVA